MPIITTKVLKSNKRMRTETATQTDVNSTYDFEEVNTIQLHIPRTASTHSDVICANTNKTISIPKSAYFDTFVSNNIIIPKGIIKIL